MQLRRSYTLKPIILNGFKLVCFFCVEFGSLYSIVSFFNNKYIFVPLQYWIDRVRNNSLFFFKYYFIRFETLCLFLSECGFIIILSNICGTISKITKRKKNRNLALTSEVQKYCNSTSEAQIASWKSEKYNSSFPRRSLPSPRPPPPAPRNPPRQRML